MKRKGGAILLTWLLLASFCFFCVSFQKEVEKKQTVQKARECIAEEKTLAENFLNRIKSGEWNEKEGEFVPDYGKGNLDCVLQIPSIQMTRGVYGGTEQEIEENLEQWMLVTAASWMKFGKTGYGIFGHNHPAYEVGFNRLGELEPGDEFLLTGRTEERIYRIEGVTVWSRQEAARNLSGENLSDDQCYIMTCARNERGENTGEYLVVQGVQRQRGKTNDEKTESMAWNNDFAAGFVNIRNLRVFYG